MGVLVGQSLPQALGVERPCVVVWRWLVMAWLSEL
jgi:hypothetical protein